MGGPDSSRKWAVKRALPSIIKGKDILALHERGETDIYPDTLAAARLSQSAPSILTGRDHCLIRSCWMFFAKQGKLRGIRTHPQSPKEKT